MQSDKPSYEQFRTEWLEGIDDQDLPPLEKGRRFASKLITQWLGITTDDDDFVICDGSGDGGIDVAYLQHSDNDPDSHSTESLEGDVWYLVQSKYGTAFSGSATILAEGDKVITTLRGHNQHLSEDSKHLLQKLDSFREKASDSDRLVLVFATTDPIPNQDRQALDNVKLLGRKHIMPNFDVEEVSLQTIWGALDDVDPPRLSVSVKGQFVEQSSGLLVGTVPLFELFEFLKSYQKETGNLDQLYEKNVRQFLGNRRKVNKGIATTLSDNPDKFGLYNNGITIVVSGYSKLPADNNVITMHDPYVVNGCQTTRSIWSVLDGKINTGGTGHNDSDNDWHEKAARGGVVTKIVRSDEAEITNITRFTNSQNSVREQDFIALNSGFQSWASEMARDYELFLEIQRGGTESRKAWEKQHPEVGTFNDYVNAFDLIKVYGAGWMSRPGLAFGKNAPFLPNGTVYERILARGDGDTPFGKQDLYGAYKIKCVADKIGFGRNSDRPSRRQSRFLFYNIIMRMLGEVIRLTPQLGQPVISESVLTGAILKLSSPQAEEQLNTLSTGAITLLDQYLTVGSNNSAHNEKSFNEVHNGDLNGFLKSESLGTESHTPLLVQSIAIQNAAFNMSGGRDKVAEALISG